MATFRDKSRHDYNVEEGNFTFEQLNAGSLQRIADATEAMAKNYVQLQKDKDWYEKNYRLRNQQIETLNRRISSLKGVITKLKNKSHASNS